jgi:hypothetical protein
MHRLRNALYWLALRAFVAGSFCAGELIRRALCEPDPTIEGAR